jgi:glycosyltransferase involved in cell wall biosynthesis
MKASEKPRLISVIIPVFNEESNIERAYDRVRNVFEGLSDRYVFEIVFTDNHSYDRSFEIIRALASRDPRVRGVRFARNFGFARSVLTGYRLAAGDAAAQIDCDLQDPPEMLPKFIELWERGHDVVVGVRCKSHSQTYQWARNLFYRLLRRISDDGIVLDSGDFRLLDRSILDQLRVIDDAMPYLRGLTSLLAKNQAGVQYERTARQAGVTKFPLRKLVGFAVDGVLAHSTVPLRLSMYLGLVIATITLLLSFGYILARLVFDVSMPAGFATTTVLLLFGISLNAILLGIIGEYVGRIYSQVRTRPTTVVEAAVNIAPETRAEPWPLPVIHACQRNGKTRDREAKGTNE